MANFENYILDELREDPRGVYGLADGLVPEMALVTGYELSDVPNTEELSRFIAHIGPAKTLQDNIARVREVLGTDSDATDVAASWVERSGVMEPVRRSFAGGVEVPNTFDSMVITSGVANWMLRRVSTAEREDADSVGRTVVIAGNRQMGEGEHQLVRRYAKEHGSLPTEADFARTFLLGRLTLVGFKTEIIDPETSNGDQAIAEALQQNQDILDGTVLVVSNAPNTVQAGGQLRQGARQLSQDFDIEGSQVFIVSDSFPVARKGQAPATHQNPFTALGQIARNALLLHKNL